MAEQNGIESRVVLFLLLLFLGCGLWFGWIIGKHRTRIDAVRNGAGEFYLPDKEAQTPDFRWKTNTIYLKGE
jgi:hypothetical protein